MHQKNTTGGAVVENSDPRAAAFSKLFADLGPSAEIVRDIIPDLLDREVEHGYSDRGAKTRPGQWATKRASLAGLILGLCRHVPGDKDGPALTCGRLLGGQRTKQAVAHADLLGLDIDSGIAFDVLVERIREMRLFAVVHTTHSHLKDFSDIPEQAFDRWATAEGLDTNVEAMARFLSDVRGMLPEFVDSVSSFTRPHTEDGVVFRVRHNPIPKARAIFVLQDRWTFADRGPLATAHVEWRQMCEQLADEVGVPIDLKCTDPSRLFFFPRHPKGAAEFRSAVIFGDLLDGEALLDLAKRERPHMTQGSRRKPQDRPRPVTPSGLDLMTWAARYAPRFEILDALERYIPDDLHSTAAGGIGRHVVCPFEEEHSTLGGEGTFLVNASETDGAGFRVNCQHNGCAGRDRLDFLARWIETGALPESALTEYLIEFADDGAPGASPTMGEAEIAKLIGELDRHDGAGRERILAAIAGRAHEIERESLLALLRDRTKVSVATLRKAISALRKSDEERPHDGHVSTLPDGHRVLHYLGAAPDQVEGRAFLVETMQLQNRAGPVWTSSMGAVVKLERHDGRAVFEPLRPEAFAAKLGAVCSFAEVVGDGERLRRELPHRDLCSAVFHTAADALPPLPELRRAPTFNSAGELLDRDGHHGDVFVDLGGLKLPAIPSAPTPADIAKARALILDQLLGDFPFRDRTAAGEVTADAGRANAVAMLLTPFMRDLFTGPAPAFGIVKPAAASGGTLLAKLSALLLDGEEAAPTAYETSEAEMQKVLVSLAMSGASHVFFDDVTEFNSRVLLRSLTAEKIGGRVLGLSQMMTRPNRLQWVVTGNNFHTADEMARRICWIRLNAQRPDVTARTFRHADLIGWTKDRRPVLIAALLTLVKAWVRAGRPDHTAEGMASFGGWSRAVGGVLDVAGIAGFLTNRRPVTADRDAAEIEAFANAWAAQFGRDPVSEADLYRWAAVAVEEMTPGREEAERKGAFGRRLESLDGKAFRIEGRLRMIERAGPDWMLDEVAE